MNVSIEKIENGFIVTLGSKKTFCDVPEAVCGVLAEWALKMCENIDAENDRAQFLERMAQQQQLAHQMYSQQTAAAPSMWPDPNTATAAPAPWYRNIMGKLTG